MRIIRLSVKNPVFVNLIMAVVLIWGFITYQNINREAFPEVSRDTISIITQYQGSSPTEIEKLITIPVENQVADIGEIEEIESHSVQGRSVVLLKIKPSTDNTDSILFDVQSEIDSLTDLPDQADEPDVSKIKTNIPLITVGVSGNLTETQLYSKVERFKNKFEAITGVSDVRLMGKRDRKIWVDIDPYKSRHYEVYLPDIYQSLKQSSFNQPGGRLQGPIREILVRTVAQAKTSEQIRQRIVRSGNPRPLKIDDLAEVYPGFEKWVTRGRINGKPGVSMTLFKSKNGDAIRIVEELNAMIQKINTKNKNLTLTTYADISEYIKDRIDTMEYSAVLALILVLLALFITLNGRIALMTALGLPVSVFGTFLFMSYLNISINMISLFGLIIVLGILVDDAIVITENIYRNMELGLPPDEASVKGTEEVFYPVLATITTNIAAFLPLMMIGGLTGKFMVVIPIMITITLLASLFEAFVILPSHMAEFVRATDSSKQSWREVWLKPIREYTLTLASFCLRHRGRMIAFIAILVPLLGYFVTFMPVKFFHMQDIKFFRINVQAPPGSSLGYTESLVEDIEQSIDTLDDSELRAFVSTLGWQQTRMGDLRYAPERAQITVELTDPNNRSRNGESIMSDIRNEILPYPEVRHLDFIKQQAGPPTGKPIEIEVSGPSIPTLIRISKELKQKLITTGKFLKNRRNLNESPVYDVKTNIVQGKSEYRIEPIPTKIGQYNITNQQVARVASLSVDGLEAATFQENREEIEIMTRLDPEYLTPENLESVRVPLPNGSAVPLKNLASLSLTNSPAEINRINQNRNITVSASVDKQVITGRKINNMLGPFINQTSGQYENYEFKLGGEYEEQEEAYQDLGMSLPIALLIIYTILAGLFNSFLEPFVVVLTVPFSLIGVILGLLIMGHSITFTAVMGTVALGGIVVNDSLILVDFIHKNNIQSNNPYIGILRAIRQRIRPVILTTLTTSAGLLPIAFEIGLSGVESFLAPMAVAMMFGLLFSTLITLILVPVVYLIFDDLRRMVFTDP